VGLANLLYAALTARWPGLPVDSALPPAPYTEGHLRTPRQVRGGVPREVDEVVAQALGDETLLRGLPEIVSPAEFAAALGPLRASTEDAHPYGADSGPIIDLETRQPRLINNRLVPVQVWQRWAVGIGVLLLAVVVAGLLVGGKHGYLSFVRGAEPAALTPTLTPTPTLSPSPTSRPSTSPTPRTTLSPRTTPTPTTPPTRPPPSSLTPSPRPAPSRNTRLKRRCGHKDLGNFALDGRKARM